MKKEKNLVLILVFFLVSLSLYSFQNGDYKTVASGNWHNSSIWKKYQNGQWVYSGVPNGSQNIYIKSGHTVNFDSHLEIKKSLIIEHNASLIPNYSSYGTYKEILFTGFLMKIDGQIKDGNGKTITIRTKNSEFQRRHIIEGSGKIDITTVNLEGNTVFNIKNLNISTLRFLKDHVTATFVDSPRNISNFTYIYMLYKNDKLILQNPTIVTHTLTFGAGTNFNEAAELILKGHAILQLVDKDTAGYEVLKPGYHMEYAKLILEGHPNQKVKITSYRGGHWSIHYPSSYSHGENIMISAKNAIFEKMDHYGLVIKKDVVIDNDEFVNCEFRYADFERWSALLSLEGPRNLVLEDAVFQDYSYPTKYNIHYYGSSLGNITVHGFSGNLAGEQFEWDYYNRVIWYNSKEKSEMENTPDYAKVSLTNYPNPFNPQTTISYNITEESNVELTVYNSKGQLINKLVDNIQDKGTHSIVWDGKNKDGRKVASGIYFYTLKLNGKPVATKKCIILK